jgi:hypothetical protein
LSLEVRERIWKMSRANPLWGAPRIHGELLKLGLAVSEATTAKYMARQRKPPSQTWRTFLNNHARQWVATDFFVVPTVTFRVLYVFIVLAHERRRLLHFNVTAHPTSKWTTQQVAEAFNHGEVVQIERPLEVYQNPVNTFVARFLGNPQMNMLKGTVALQDGGAFLHVCGSSIELPAQALPELRKYAGRAVIVGVRPEDMIMSNLPRSRSAWCGSPRRSLRWNPWTRRRC